MNSLRLDYGRESKIDYGFLRIQLYIRLKGYQAANCQDLRETVTDIATTLAVEAVHPLETEEALIEYFNFVIQQPYKKEEDSEKATDTVSPRATWMAKTTLQFAEGPEEEVEDLYHEELSAMIAVALTQDYLA